MALDPPSDVVLEVAQAADPTRAAAVAQRLNALGAAAGQSGDFAQTLAQTAPGSASQPVIAGLPNARAALADREAAASGKAAKAQVGFEAMLLNSFVKEMMPKDATATFGQGLAGDMWKSMMADQIANQIAKSGTLGIARRLFAAHPLPAGDSLEHATRLNTADTHDAAQMSSNALSLPSSAKIDHGSILFADRKRS
jgi:flagellar protein FlgJ